MHSKIGRNMAVKTQEEEGLISDLAKTFNNLRKFKMKLNPEKCTIGVPSLSPR
jgi:hypothetical protein